MNRNDRVRMQHMLDAANEALAFAANQTRQSLVTNRMLALSLVKDIEIIGEAAAQLSEECHNTTPQIPWPSIIAMRNRLIHAYFDIDLDRVWDTITADLPPLISELEEILSAEE